MPILQFRVVFPSTKLPDTEANRQRVFTFTGIGATSNGTGPFGNLGRRNVGSRSPADATHYFNLNNPIVQGAISVSSYARITCDSHDFSGDQSLAGQVSYAIEQGYIIVEDTAAPGVPLTRTVIMTYV